MAAAIPGPPRSWPPGFQPARPPSPWGHSPAPGEAIMCSAVPSSWLEFCRNCGSDSAKKWVACPGSGRKAPPLHPPPPCQVMSRLRPPPRLPRQGCSPDQRDYTGSKPAAGQGFTSWRAARFSIQWGGVGWLVLNRPVVGQYFHKVR